MYSTLKKKTNLNVLPLILRATVPNALTKISKQISKQTKQTIMDTEKLMSQAKNREQVK